MRRSGCTPEQRAVCPLRGHFTDCHHRYFPRRWYGTDAAKEFRDLPENKVDLCRNEHNELHRTQEPPVKPPEWYMEARVNIAKRMVAETVNTDDVA